MNLNHRFLMAGALAFLVLCGAAPGQPQKNSGAVQDAKTCYLFSYFINNGEDGLHLAFSLDGYKWKPLGGGRSYLKPEVGEPKLMRDPCLMRDPDGLFRMVWTTSWKGNTIGYASSRDLLDWSPQQAIPVMEHEAGAKNCWAPELYYERDGKYLIFWSSTLAGRFDETHRMYCCTTTDFKTFTPARLFFDPGYNVIDGTLARAGDKYVLIHKDERQEPVKKNLRLAFADSPEGPWTGVTEPFTRDWVEGPTALRIGEETIVYFDCYRDKKYGALKTRDFTHWEDVSDRLAMPAGVRHGTALEVPSEAVIKLLQHEVKNTPPSFLQQPGASIAPKK